MFDKYSAKLPQSSGTLSNVEWDFSYHTTLLFLTTSTCTTIFTISLLVNSWTRLCLIYFNISTGLRFSEPSIFFSNERTLWFSCSTSVSFTRFVQKSYPRIYNCCVQNFIPCFCHPPYVMSIIAVQTYCNTLLACHFVSQSLCIFHYYQSWY